MGFARYLFICQAPSLLFDDVDAQIPSVRPCYLHAPDVSLTTLPRLLRGSRPSDVVHHGVFEESTESRKRDSLLAPPVSHLEALRCIPLVNFYLSCSRVDRQPHGILCCPLEGRWRRMHWHLRLRLRLRATIIFVVAFYVRLHAAARAKHGRFARGWHAAAAAAAGSALASTSRSLSKVWRV